MSGGHEVLDMKRDSDPVEFNPKEVRRTTNGFIIRFELLGLIIALAVQTMTGVWWGATLTTKMDFLQQSIVAMKLELKESMQDRYTSRDAARDFEIRDRIIKANELRIERLENKA